MNPQLEELMARQRLDEARAEAARYALLRDGRRARRPLRIIVGFALIKAGHWVAGRAPRRGGRPRPAVMA
jgi:hypothetical protein